MSYRYKCIVHACNRNMDYGWPVSVIADSRQEAVNKAVTAGWSGRASDARVVIREIEEIPASQGGAS